MSSEEVLAAHGVDLAAVDVRRLDLVRAARRANLVLRVTTFLLLVVTGAVLARDVLAGYSSLPFADVTVLVDGCEYLIPRSAAPLPSLAWVLALAAVLVAGSRPGAARASAAAAVTVASVATGIYGASWLLPTALGRSPVPDRCPPEVDGAALKPLLDYGQYHRASTCLLLAVGVALLVARAGAVPPSGSARSRRSWWLVLPVAPVLAFLVLTYAVYGPWTRAREVQDAAVEGLAVPLHAVLSALLVLSFAVLVPRDGARRLGVAAAEALVGVALAQWALFEEASSEYLRTALVGDAVQVTSALSPVEQQTLNALKGLYGSLMAAGAVLLLVAGAYHLLTRPAPGPPDG